jgi:hypothetical protein
VFAGIVVILATMHVVLVVAVVVRVAQQLLYRRNLRGRHLVAMHAQVEFVDPSLVLRTDHLPVVAPALDQCLAHGFVAVHHRMHVFEQERGIQAGAKLDELLVIAP